jgi:hypothetical protein
VSAAWLRDRSLLPYNDRVVHWQVRAQSDSAVFTCGVVAADQPAAEEQARGKIPFPGPYWFTVTPVSPRPEPAG